MSHPERERGMTYAASLSPLRPFVFSKDQGEGDRTTGDSHVGHVERPEPHVSKTCVDEVGDAPLVPQAVDEVPHRAGHDEGDDRGLEPLVVPRLVVEPAQPSEQHQPDDGEDRAGEVAQ